MDGYEKKSAHVDPKIESFFQKVSRRAKWKKIIP